MAPNTKNSKNRADYVCDEYKESLPPLQIVADVYAGTLAMRAAQTTYMPKNPSELDEEYRSRLKRSVFPPFFKRAIGKLTGIVTKRDPNWKDTSPQFLDDFKNIDGAGTKGEVFGRNALAAAIRDGHSLIYVDLPPPVQETASLASEPTLKDEADANLRPHWILYKKAQAINWRTEIIDGQTILTLLVLREEDKVSDGDYGSTCRTLFRVLRPGSWEVYALEKKQLVLIESGSTSLDYIPIYPVYGEECAPFESEPPLIELALMNIQLWQKQSDLDNILHIANVPIMWCRDRNTNVPFQAVGPSILIDLKGEHSEIGFAEHGGNAISAAQADIERLKGEMGMAALEMFAEKTPGPKTATGEIIDTAESNSELSLMVKSYQSAMQKAYETHEAMMNQTASGTFEPNVEYDRLVFTVEEMNFYKALVDAHGLSLETMLELLKRAGKFGPDFDVKEELLKIFGPDNVDAPDVERDVMLETERLGAIQATAAPPAGSGAPGAPPAN
jgi:hypothetical protein